MRLARELCNVFDIEFEDLMLDVTHLSAENLNESEGTVWVNQEF